jgi:hypothetical protein
MSPKYAQNQDPEAISMKKHGLHRLFALIVASAALLLAGCLGLRLGGKRAPSTTIAPAVTPTAVAPSSEATATPTPVLPAAGKGTVPRSTATATMPAPSLDLCDVYLDLLVSAREIKERAIVTSYRCGNAWIDSTGRSPSRSPTFGVGHGVPIQLLFGATQSPQGTRPPEAVDVRLYPVVGVSATFGRWPEELPPGVKPVDRVEFGSGTSYGYIPRLPPGEYTLVARATWGEDADVYYALSLRLGGDVTPAAPATETPAPAGPTPTATPAPAGWSTYTDPVYAVSLQYPAHWQLTPGYDGRRYSGEDGFFALDAIDSPEGTIDDVAASQAGHKLRPYGSQPTIEPWIVQGQEARLILPSADANMGGQAMLVARYPQPVQIGGLTYRYLALYADQGHIRPIALSLRFTGGTPSPARGPRIVSFQVIPNVAAPGDVVILRWEAEGDRAILCPSARYLLFTPKDCQQVPLSGETAFTFPQEAAGFPSIDFVLEVEAEGAPIPEVWQVSVARKCPLTWFYSAEAQTGFCPTDPLRSYAAAQRFERGTMIWLERIGRYYLLVEAPLLGQETRNQLELVQDPLEVVRDTSAEVFAPAGLYAPESGFGLVWRGDVRGSSGYRDAFGWALGPEFGYQAVHQCDDAPPSGGRAWQTCALLGPDGEVVLLHPLGGWQLWDGRVGH